MCSSYGYLPVKLPRAYRKCGLEFPAPSPTYTPGTTAWGAKAEARRVTAPGWVRSEPPTLPARSIVWGKSLPDHPGLSDALCRDAREGATAPEGPVSRYTRTWECPARSRYIGWASFGRETPSR